RTMCVSGSPLIKPVFKRTAPAAMPEHIAIPQALERRHLVVTGAASGLESQVGIGAHAHRQDVVLFEMVLRHVETLDRSQSIVGVQRRSVAVSTALAVKDFPALLGKSIELVRVRRRLQRVDVKRKGV